MLDRFHLIVIDAAIADSAARASSRASVETPRCTTGGGGQEKRTDVGYTKREGFPAGTLRVRADSLRNLGRTQATDRHFYPKEQIARGLD